MARHNNPSLTRENFNPSVVQSTNLHSTQQHTSSPPSAVPNQLAPRQRSIELDLGEAHQSTRGNHSAGSTGSIRSAIRQRASQGGPQCANGDVGPLGDLMVGNPQAPPIEGAVPQRSPGNPRPPREDLVTEPVSPSIPLLRSDASLGLDMEGRGGSGGTSHKPPSGQGNTVQGRKRMPIL